MPDSKITALTSIGASTDPANDPLVLVDVSDTSMAATGTTKKVTLNQLLGASGTATLASATITGDLTVDTSTLKVDSANNRVGVVNASPAYPLDVVGNINTDSELYSQGGRLALYRPAGASYHDWASGQALVWRTVTSVGGAGASELMRLNSTGLGVGASPSHRLTVSGTAATNTTGLGLIGTTTGYNRVLINNTSGGGQFGVEGSSGGNLCVGSTAYSTVVGSYQNYSLHFITNNNVQATIDSSGNVGIGVTPSAWNSSSYRVLQIGTIGSHIAANTTTYSAAPFLFIGNNAYGEVGAGFKYTSSQPSAQYRQENGSHQWFTAPSGTAGTAITFTQAMTLDASGRLIINSSTFIPPTLNTNGELNFIATSNTNVRFSYRGTDGVTRVANITLA